MNYTANLIKFLNTPLTKTEGKRQYGFLSTAIIFLFLIIISILIVIFNKNIGFIFIASCLFNMLVCLVKLYFISYCLKRKCFNKSGCAVKKKRNDITTEVEEETEELTEENKKLFDFFKKEIEQERKEIKEREEKINKFNQKMFRFSFRCLFLSVFFIAFSFISYFDLNLIKAFIQLGIFNFSLWLICLMFFVIINRNIGTIQFYMGGGFETLKINSLNPTQEEIKRNIECTQKKIELSNYLYNDLLFDVRVLFWTFFVFLE